MKLFTRIPKLPLALLAASLYAAQAQAATITVNETTCTLINAIHSANGDADTGGCVATSLPYGSDTIVIAPNTPVVLTTTVSTGLGLPAIASVISVQGNGNTISRQAGSPSFRLFQLLAGGNLTLDRVVLTGGNDLAVRVLPDASFTLSNSTVSGNSSANIGGGISTSGTTVIRRSTISGNAGTSGGGGVFVNGGSATISDSTISGNSCTGTSSNGGGGLLINGSMTTATVLNSTITTNTCNANGGGISLLNSAAMTLRNSIVAGNSVTVFGPAEVRTVTSIAPTTSNNVLGHSGLTDAQAFQFFTPNGSDIRATSDGTNRALASILNTTLTSNGGPTQTHALVTGSPAINASGTGATTRDQRGFAPPADGAARDIGAFEFNGVDPAPTVTALSPASGPVAGGISVTIGGANFTGATSVKFGTVDATIVGTPTATSITATSPAGTGTVNVTVTTPDGTSSTTGTADDFTYQSNVSGECGPAHNAPTSSTPTAGLCTTGTATAVTSNGQFLWSCTGSGTGTTAQCNAAFAPQRLTLELASNSILIGGSTSASASSTSGLPPTIATSTTSICSVGAGIGSPLVRAGVSGNAAGSCIVSAAMAASAANCTSQCFQAADPVSQTITVNKLAQTIAFGTAPTVVVDGTGTVSATASPSNLAVSFSTPMSANCSVSGSTVTGLKAGDCTVLGNQAGNATYNAAAQAMQTFAIGKGSQAITGFMASPSTINAQGSPATLIATGGKSGNAVTFATSTGTVCSVSGTSVSGLAEGSCTVTANQAGNDDYTAAPQQTITVTVTAPLSACTRFATQPGVNVIDLRSAPGGQTARGVNGQFNVIYGSAFADSLTGGSAGNCIDGGMGNDRLTAGAGSNSLYGAEGNDTLTPSTGNTLMDGGAGTDRCGRVSGRATATYASCEAN